MPEAVSSNSISASNENPLDNVSDLLISLEEIGDVLHSFREFLNIYLRDKDDRLAMGFDYVFRREIDNIDETRRYLAKAFQKMKGLNARLSDVEPFVGTVWVGEVWVHINSLYFDVMRDAGHDIDPDDTSKWPEEIRRSWQAEARGYYDMLMNKMNGSRDLLLAGSFLPWIEHVMRKRVGGAALDKVGETDLTSTVDRLRGANLPSVSKAARG